MAMHVITLRPLRRFAEIHPEAEASLRSWIQVARKATWRRFDDVRASLKTADQVDKFTVFNIAHNKYRLITVIHFNRSKVYVRKLLTHAEYDRGDWKK